MKLNSTQLHRAAHAMNERGGAFAAAIAAAYFAADQANRERVVVAFGDLFERAHRVYVNPEE